MLFEQFPDFVTRDNRNSRPTAQTTAESLQNRFSAMLPPEFIKNCSILDIGSCVGAAGHWCLTHGATRYTGVEIQKEYADISQELLSQYWNHEQYNIVCEDILTFLETQRDHYDIVIVFGVLYAFLNPFELLDKLTRICNQHMLFDNINVDESNVGESGCIVVDNQGRINSSLVSPALAQCIGPSSFVGHNALNILMKSYGFCNDAGKIFPKRILNSHDSYHDINPVTDLPMRYFCRFTRSTVKVKTLQEQLQNRITECLPAPLRVPDKNTTQWNFNHIAPTYRQEALDHIPDYSKVIDLSIELADIHLNKTNTIVDVGSALGYTVDSLINAGFTNVWGVEANQHMIEASQHPDRIIMSDVYPAHLVADMIIANYTLHFIDSRFEYIQSVFSALQPNGIFVITDKTQQSDIIKNLYYNFKRNNGVSEEYIKEKEKRLQGYMNALPIEWYIITLYQVGFKSVEVINSRLGFVTFYCQK